jgi:hypothetical protein
VRVGFFDEANAKQVLRDTMLSVGLLDPHEHGVIVHDYLDYNRSKAEVESYIAKRKAAGQKGGKASGEARAKQKGSKCFENRSSKTNPKAEADTETDNTTSKSDVVSSHANLSECCDLITSEFGTFPTVKQREKLTILCDRYPDALDRVRFGIDKAKDAKKPNAAFAIGCAESASVQEMKPPEVEPVRGFGLDA